KPHTARNDESGCVAEELILELQTASELSSILHVERSTRPDRVCDLARYHGIAATADCRWKPGTGLWHSHRFRSARTISAQCSDSSAARRRSASGKIRSAQAQTRSRRIVRAGT